MKKVLLSLLLLFCFTPVLAVDLTFCAREWVYQYEMGQYGCSCNAGAGCKDTDLTFEHRYFPAGAGRALPGAVLVLVDRNSGATLNSTSTSSCVTYSAIEGNYIDAQIYNVSYYAMGGFQYINPDPTNQFGDYNPPLWHAGRQEFPELFGAICVPDYWGSFGNCILDSNWGYPTQPCQWTQYGVKCALTTMGWNSTYIIYMSNANVTWKNTMTNAMTAQPIENLLISVAGKENYTDSAGVSYHTGVNALKDIAIHYGGQRVGDYTGESWDAGNVDDPQDIAYYEGSNEIWVLNGPLGASHNESIWIYHKNNGTLIRSMDLSEPSPPETDRTGLAIDSYYMFLGNDFANNIARRVKDYSGDWTYNTTATCSSPKGLDISFLGGGVNDTDRYVYCNDFYKRVVFQYHALNGTYVGIALNYSDDLSENTYVYGLTTNNIYMWLLTYNVNFGISDVLQYGFDGTYVGSWDTEVDSTIPQGIETDGTRFWVIFEDGLVKQYWRVGNSSQGYYPMSQTIYPEESFCKPYLYSECESICGIQFSAPPIEDNIAYMWIYVLNENGDPVKNANVIWTADQDPGIQQRFETANDGGQVSGIYTREGWTYSVKIFGPTIRTYEQSGISLPIITSPGDDIEYNYLNFTVSELDIDCSEMYEEIGDVYWTNGTVYRDITITCTYTSLQNYVGTNYYCNPGWKDGTTCYMGKEINCAPGCLAEVREIWACDNGFFAPATLSKPPADCSEVVRPSQVEVIDIGNYDLFGLVAQGINTATGGQPSQFYLLAMFVVPVGVGYFTKMPSIAIMSLVILLGLFTVWGIVPLFVPLMLIMAVVAYFLITTYGRAGGGGGKD